MSAELPDLTPIFDRYENFVAQTDALFQKVQSEYPEEVICHEGCSSCCYALFDLSLIEALYLNAKFNEKISDGVQKFQIFSNADEIDRKTAVLKRSFYNETKDGVESREILTEVARERVRCPLLNDENLCVLYDHRPITCRLYGVPTAIEGKAHTCGKTGFKQGENYPTVHLDKIQDHLSQLSFDLAEYIGTSFPALHTMYVPVSAALIATYDASYLGVRGAGKKD